MIRTTLLCLLVFISACAGINTGEPNAKWNAKVSQDGEAWCEMCILVMDQVRVLMKEKESQGKVNETLYDMCNMVSGLMRKECYDMIPNIEREITKGVDPEKACEMFTLCGEGHAVHFIRSFASKVNAGKVNTWGDVSEVMRTMTPHLEKVMRTMTPHLEKVMRTMTPHLEKAMRTMTPHIENMMMSAKGEGEAVKAGLPCSMCKMVVRLIDKNLDSYKESIVTYVTGICDDLPNPTNKACADALSYYIPMWWDSFFRTIISADKLCESLHMCADRRRS